DCEQHQIETALGLVAARRRQELRQFGDLGANRSRTGRGGARARTLARALAVEESGVDGGARAAERNERDGDTRILNRKRKRGARLVTVERAVTRTTEPARALLCPLARPSVVLVRHRGAGFIAAEARPSRPVIFAAAKALEAKPLIRQLHGPVGIALAGRDRVSHPGDQHIAHQDLAHQPQRGAVRQNDVDACKGRPSADQAGLDFLVAGAADLAGVTANSSAASRREAPLSTSAITRSRISPE